jgi:hypothetical protein
MKEVSYIILILILILILMIVSSRDVSDMPRGRPQFCVAAVSQKLLPYNIIAF